MKTQISSFKQNTSYTCGTCALMVLENELSASDHKYEKHVELKIWRSLIPNLIKFLRLEFIWERFVGTPPVCLARYFESSNKLQYQLYLFQHPHNNVGNYRYLFQVMCHIHDHFFISRFQLPFQKVKSSLLRQCPNDLIRLLGQNPYSRILQVISVPGGMLHYLLIRKIHNNITVMDPGNGQNSVYSESHFAEAFRHNLYGYCLLISPSNLRS